jgi:hypothetical protein
MIARGLIVGVIGLALAVQVVRYSAVRAFADVDPAAAERIAPGHPEVELTAAMTDIAKAARSGRPVGAATLSRIADASKKMPLAPEPFLVRGVEAQLAGDRALAERAFLAARWRDGRSLPARYFLADQYFRAGDATHGLREITALARLAPGGVRSLAPYVAAYAQRRSNWPEVRGLLAAEPGLEDATLAALAKDPANADAALAIANPGRTGPRSPWLEPLLDRLVDAGAFAKARTIWASVSRLPAGGHGLIYDPQFEREDAPPPFNWALTSSTVGLAERLRGGGLHVIAYGHESGVLAEQLLLLPAGEYRLETRLAAAAERAAALEWTISCEGSRSPLASIALDAAAKQAWAFAIPSGCAAQRLALVGRAGDFPRQAELTIQRVTLSRGGGRG